MPQMPQPPDASSIPLAQILPFRPDSDGLGVVATNELLPLLGNAADSLRKWLRSAERLSAYGLAEQKANLAVEMCHVLGGLDKSVALCAAEADDKSQQELLIKCAFHLHRLRPTWSAICEETVGKSLDALDPTTSTLTFQLALEELAKKDVLAFSYVIDVFGTPGNLRSIDGVAEYFRPLLPDAVFARTVETWKRASSENGKSFASIDTAKPYGYPLSGSYGDACARHLGGLLERDVEKTLARIGVVADYFHLFYRGVQVFYVSKGSAFPRMRLDWLEV